MGKITKKKAFKIFALLAIAAVFVVFAVTKRSVANGLACEPQNLSGEFEAGVQTATFEEQKISVPEIALKENDVSVLGQSNEEKWIEVDLSEQKLRAWDGSNLFLETLVSTGLPWWPTPQGEYRIWAKVRATKMEGGTGKYYYYLPNVPYVMFFENESVPGFRGYGLHGTYWHNDFGTQKSHGCVNLPTPVAEKLYYWAAPVNPEGKGFTRSSTENPGTRIIVHE